MDSRTRTRAEQGVAPLSHGDGLQDSTGRDAPATQESNPSRVLLVRDRRPGDAPLHRLGGGEHPRAGHPSFVANEFLQADVNKWVQLGDGRAQVVPLVIGSGMNNARSWLPQRRSPDCAVSHNSAVFATGARPIKVADCPVARNPLSSTGGNWAAK